MLYRSSTNALAQAWLSGMKNHRSCYNIHLCRVAPSDYFHYISRWGMIVGIQGKEHWPSYRHVMWKPPAFLHKLHSNVKNLKCLTLFFRIVLQIGPTKTAPLLINTIEMRVLWMEIEYIKSAARLLNRCWVNKGGLDLSKDLNLLCWLKLCLRV